MALSLEAVVMLNKGGFDSGLSTMGALTRNVAGSMAYAFGGVAGEIATMARAFGPVGAIVASLKQVVQAGTEFQQSMANVASVTSLTAVEFQNVEENARDFASTTSFTAQQTADALYALGSAGFSTATQLNDMLSPALKLAGATQAETKQSTEVMTAAINAFGLSTTDAARVADMFAGAIANSPANMERLGEAVGQAAPVAAAFNMSLEQTVESLAAFHKVGIMGSEAGTSFRQAMTQLNIHMQKTDSTLGKVLTGWSPQLDGLTGAIKRMEAAGISGSEAMSILGIRGGKAVAAQLALGSDAIKALGKTIVETGDVTKMYEIQMDTVSSQWKVFISMIKESGLRVWDQIKDAVQAVVEGMQAGVGWIQKFWEAFGKGSGVGFEFLLESFNKVWAALEAAVSQAMTILGPIIAEGLERLKQIDWMDLGITAGVRLMEGLTAGMDAAAKWLSSEGAAKIAKSIGEMLGTVVAAIAKFFVGANAAIAEGQGGLIESVAGLLMGLRDFIAAFVDGMVSGITGNPLWKEYVVFGITNLFLHMKAAIIEKGAMVVAAAKNFALSLTQSINEGLASGAEFLGFEGMAASFKTTADQMEKDATDSMLKAATAGAQTRAEIANLSTAWFAMLKEGAAESSDQAAKLATETKTAAASAAAALTATAQAARGIGTATATATAGMTQGLSTAAGTANNLETQLQALGKPIDWNLSFDVVQDIVFAIDSIGRAMGQLPDLKIGGLDGLQTLFTTLQGLSKIDLGGLSNIGSIDLNVGGSDIAAIRSMMENMKGVVWA